MGRRAWSGRTWPISRRETCRAPPGARSGWACITPPAGRWGRPVAGSAAPSGSSSASTARSPSMATSSSRSHSSSRRKATSWVPQRPRAAPRRSASGSETPTSTRSPRTSRGSFSSSRAPSSMASGSWTRRWSRSPRARRRRSSTGLVYCGVILACVETFDVRRAQEWTDVLTRWCDEQPDLVAFTGRCLVHRAELLQLRGAWPDAMERGSRCGGAARPGLQPRGRGAGVLPAG